MEKVWNSDDLLPKKFKSIMKITLLFLILGILHVSADTYAQKAQVTVEVKSGTFYDVVSEIEKQTEFMFFYKSEDIDNSKQVDIQVKNRQVTDVLNELLKNTNLTYRISGKHITILKKDAVQQQKKNISGTVTDPDGIPVIGANVVIKGTTVGTVTDLDGKFSLDAANNDILSFSYIGYAEQEIEVGNRTLFNVKLAEDYKALEEVVVVGYGTMLKRNLSTSVGSVDSEKLLERPNATNVFQGLAGKVAGVNIALNSGAPGGSPAIKIRGIGSLNSSNTPLYVVDGVVGVDPDQIDPNIVQSIDILKDATSSSIYGARGANGVIVITTNRAKATKLSMEYNGSISFETFAKHADMLTANDYRRLTDDPDFPGIQDEGTTTDWVDAISRTAISHNHFLSLKGGSAESNYVASIDYRKREGVIRHTDRESITAKIGLNHNMFNNKLRFQFNINDSYVTQQRAWYAAYLNALLENPTRPIYDENGNYTEYKVNLKPYNPVAMINEEYDVEGYNQLMMSGKITLSPIEGLNLSVMGAMQRFDRMENKSNTFKHMTTVVNGDYGNVWNWADNTMQKNLELVGDYTKSLGLHNLGAMIGYSYQDDDAKGIYQWAKDFPTDMFGPWNIGSMNDMKDNKAAMTSYRNTHKLISFFGRLTYNYNEKYMFMASLRREGSSRFGDNHKWGWFPAISAGWRISKENFMQDIQWLDDLKVRIGYGVTGNEVTSNLLSMYLLNYGGYAYINGKWTQGAGPYQNPNPDLKWETKSELNLGLDFSFLKNRLSGSIDIYHRETSDLLSTYEVPTPPYIVSSMMANVGKIRNQGIELLLSGTPIKTRDLRFDITGTFSYNKNKIISLSNGLYQKDYWYEGATGSPIQTHTHIVREGDPVGNFHGFQTHSLTSDGLWMVYGTDGQPKLLTDADDGDKKVIGNGIPTTYGSLNLALSYKGFDVSVMFRGAFNFQVLNRQRMHWETTSRIGEGNLPRSVLEKPFGSNSYVKGAPAMQSYYVEDGDYVKLDNISVGYTFNLKKQKVIQRLRLYVAGNNLLTMTGYKGLDPEVSIKGLAPGVEGSGAGELYPTTRQFTVGLNLLF